MEGASGCYVEVLAAGVGGYIPVGGLVGLKGGGWRGG